MRVGSAGVSNVSNTSSGQAGGVIAYGGIGRLGVSEGSNDPLIPDYIVTESGDRIDTENSLSLITE